MNRLPIPDGNETTNTIHAAAFAALGFRVAVHAKERQAVNERQCAILVSETSLTRPGLSMCQLRHQLESGNLLQLDPIHPLLDAIRALRNREDLLKWCKRGEAKHLKQESACDRWRLADGLQCLVPHGSEVFTVSELGVACGLLTCGIELVHFDGTPGAMRYHFAPSSFLLQQDPPFIDTRQLLESFGDKQWREDNPNHPLVLSWKACDAYKRLIHEINKPAAVFLEAKGSMRTAELPSDASNKALDQAFRHLRR